MVLGDNAARASSHVLARPMTLPSELTMLGLMLEFRGFHVVLTGDGRDALNAVILYSPDAVVSDLNMPHLDGLALCRAGRAPSTGGSVPVILWSSAPADDSRLPQALALSAGSRSLLCGDPKLRAPASDAIAAVRDQRRRPCRLWVSVCVSDATARLARCRPA